MKDGHQEGRDLQLLRYKEPSMPSGKLTQGNGPSMVLPLGHRVNVVGVRNRQKPCWMIRWLLAACTDQ